MGKNGEAYELANILLTEKVKNYGFETFKLHSKLKKSFNLKREDFLSDKYKTNKRLNISEIPEMIRLFCTFADKTHLL